MTTRKIPRTEGPNTPSRVAQTVDAVVAKWIPVTAALLACAVTPARAKLDVRSYDWQPSFTWVRPVVDATVRTYIPAATTELQSYRVAARPPLDVRRYEWAPESFDLVTRVDQQVRTWTGVFDNDQTNFRTSQRRSLDVRSFDWTTEESAWITATLTPPPSVAQTWPAFEETGGRTPDARRLDVRAYEWTADEAGWIQAATQTQAPSVAQTAPAWISEAQAFRTLAARPLDLFRAQSIPDIFGVPDDWITWSPIQDDGGRTRDRARLDVRAYEWAPSVSSWIAANQAAPATVAQTWPAILENLPLSYRTGARPALDVRNFEWSPQDGWRQPVVDRVTATWIPVFDAEVSTRTEARRALDVRTYRWEPEASGWIFAEQPVVITAAQAWPAILHGLSPSYRTAERAKLDVRSHDWAPEFGWAVPVVNGIVAKWAPVFNAELGYRTDDRARLNVRDATSSPELAWLLPVINVVSPRRVVADGAASNVVSATGAQENQVTAIGTEAD